METYDKEKFVKGIDHMRTIQIGGLKKKIEKAEENGDKKIELGIHDAHFLMNALLHHFDAEKGYKGSDK